MKLTNQDIIRQPLVTEKSTRARETRDVYCFKADVRTSATFTPKSAATAAAIWILFARASALKQ